MSNGRCICVDGYKRNSANVCVKEIICQDNEEVVRFQCQCKSGY